MSRTYRRSRDDYDGRLERARKKGAPTEKDDDLDADGERQQGPDADAPKNVNDGRGDESDDEDGWPDTLTGPGT
jgi:hypothetical protein